MTDQDRLKIVRDCYRAYETGERGLIDQHLSDDFVFSAPPSVGINRTTYFERCWPGSETTARFEFERLFEYEDEVVVTYEATRTNGQRFRNTEIHRFDGDKVAAVEVYFGWDVE